MDRANPSRTLGSKARSLTNLMVVVEPTSGGTFRHVAHVALECRHRGLKVVLVCPKRPDPAYCASIQQLQESGVGCYLLEAWNRTDATFDIAAILRLRSLMSWLRPEVLHLHSSKAGAVGRIAALLGLGVHRPVVLYTPHAYAHLAQPGRLNRLKYWCAERVLIPLTDYVVAISESEGTEARKLGAHGRTVVIPNGVDQPSNTESSRAKGKGLRIGWMGRWVWQKNPEAAVKISRELSRLGVRHTLVMAGDGPDRERMTGALTPEKCVQLLGFITDTNAFYRDIDLFLTTSRAEGLPYTGLDAMARGIPIAGFDVPGLRDLVDHGSTGVLAPADDCVGLARQIAWLARNPQIRHTMQGATVARVRGSFSARTQIDGLYRLYNSLGKRRVNQAWNPMDQQASTDRE